MRSLVYIGFVQAVFLSLLCGQQDEFPDSTEATSGLAYFPIVYYTPETRLAFGAGIFYVAPSMENEKPSSYAATFQYTLNKQTVAELTTNVFFDNGRYWHLGNFFYEIFPNQFYGIGNTAPDSLKENYTARIFRFNPSFLFRFSDKMFAGPVIHFESWSLQSLEPGGLLSAGTIPGSKPTTATGVGAQVIYDERDNLFAASSGRLFQAVFIAAPSFLGSTFSFSRLQIDAREYVPLGNDHIVSFQGVVNTTSGTVPFRFLPKLGGQNLLRGYFEGRYRDKKMAVLQCEYRSPFWYRFGFAVFGGIGEVAGNADQFTFNQIKPSFGAGLRFAFIPDQRINLRIDYGIGQHSDGVYITLNEAI